MAATHDSEDSSQSGSGAPCRSRVKADDLPWTTIERGQRFQLRRRQLGAAAGGKELGCSMVELPPGKRSWPLHFHCANEEAIYVLAGRGTLRRGAESVAVAAGDYLAFPAGPEHAHQMVNDSDAPLRYLCISTMREPDIAVYPESNKVGVFAGAAPGNTKQPRYLSAFLRNEPVDYWVGEEDQDS